MSRKKPEYGHNPLRGSEDPVNSDTADKNRIRDLVPRVY